MPDAIVPSALVVAAVLSPAFADEVVYDSYDFRGAVWGWSITDQGETSSLDDLPDGSEFEGMVADLVRLGPGPRFATAIELRTASFNRDEQGQADIVVRLHEIESGYPGDVFWTGTVEDAIFEYDPDGHTETLYPRLTLPDEFMISYELREVSDPGGGVLLGCTNRSPAIGSGDEDLYLFDSLGLFWYTHTPDPGHPSHLELRIHAVPAPPAALVLATLVALRPGRRPAMRTTLPLPARRAARS